MPSQEPHAAYARPVPQPHPLSSAPVLSEGTRAWLSQAFGSDFSEVKVHADSEAGRRTSAAGARAMTSGRDVYIDPHHFNPHSRAGRKLLAHEFAHVLQQGSGRLRSSQGGTRPAAGYFDLENEADIAGERAVQWGDAGAVRRAPSTIRRQASPLDEAVILARGGLEGLVNWISAQPDAAGTMIPALMDLRRRLSRQATVIAPPATAARLEEIYLEQRSQIPSWIRIPDVQFAGGATQQAAVVAIPVGAILLLLLILILIIWLLQRTNPHARHAQDRAVKEVVDRLLEGAKSPQKDPEADPEGKPPIPVDPPPPLRPEEREPVRIDKVADSNVFMDRVQGGPAQRLRIDVGYLGNPRLRLFVPAAARAEALRVDPSGTQARRLAGVPGGAAIAPDADGNVEPLRTLFPRILSRKFDENDLRIALRAKERSLPLVSTNDALAVQLRDPLFPERVAAVGTVLVETP